MSTNALRAAATGTTPADKPRTIFEYLDDARVKQGIAAVAGRFLTPDRMLRLCVMAVKKTPKLAACDPTTVLGAMMTSAALGLEPNTVQQQAFLIPYKTRRKGANGQWGDVLECQFQIGYRGFITLAYRTPRLKGLMAEAIHKGDHFKHRLGSGTFLEFEKALVDRGQLVGAFSYAQLDGGQEVACVLPLDEVIKIRSRSETYRTLVRAVEAAENESERQKAEMKLAETPWVLWEDDMAAKSAIKKHAKMLPIASNDALAVAAEIDARGEAGALDLRAMTTVEQVREVLDGDGEPPALTDDTEGQQQSREAFGTTQTRQVAAEQVQQRGNQAPEQAQQQAQGDGKPAAAARGRAKAAPAPAPASSGGPVERTYAEIADAIAAIGKDENATRDDALLELDAARHLPADQAKDLKALVDRLFPGA